VGDVALLTGRLVPLSPRRPTGADGTADDGLVVNRLLPQRSRRMIGAWCFADSYGPHDVSTSDGMQVAPHPHTGLQTVTWLVEGAVRHRDSVGSDVLVRPGTLGLMTAGRGIAHSERTPPDAPSRLHGVQLWVALPEHARFGEPAFEAHDDLPVLRLAGAQVTVFAGRLGPLVAPATTHTPLLGAELRAEPGAVVRLPLDATHEHGLLVVGGTVEVDGIAASADELLYLGPGRHDLALHARTAARVLLLGGEPFAEPIVMWWNFIGRDHDEVASYRAAWNDHHAYGPVTGDDGDPIPAPPLPGVRLRARGRAG
jgi:redox-sensitive bicupin YhaK (pirin superfamily)